MIICSNFWHETQDTFPELYRGASFHRFVSFLYSFYGISLNHHRSLNSKKSSWYEFTKKYIVLSVKLSECWLLNTLKLPAGETQKIFEFKWVLDAISRHVTIIPRLAFDPQSFFLHQDSPPLPLQVFYYHILTIW